LQFVQHRLEHGTAPERFCYLPLDANPLYQLRSDEQLQQAVRYYESRVLTSLENPEPHFLLLDDVNRIEHPSKSSVEGWGTPVRDALETNGRHIVVTASARVQVERELARVGLNDAFDTQLILPEKFRDYLFSLYPDLEVDDRRVSPTPIRRGEGSLPAALAAGDPGLLIETLRGERSKVSDDVRRIRSRIVDYLAMGGIVSYDADGAVADARSLGTEPYVALRKVVHDALYQDVPGFESVQTIADLERLCALAARLAAAEPIRYQRLVDLFDVDRRTITDSYLTALDELYLLTSVTEYDNQRPRSVRLYPRDPGLVTALTSGGPERVLDDFEREAAHARIAAFDHTMRFAYGIEAANGRHIDADVRFWRGRSGEVDFVFEVDGTPVPIALAYRPPMDDAVATIEAFCDTYEVPFGFVLAGDTVPGTTGVSQHSERVVRVPYWLYLLLC
jgi:predicted AAA+ superfamily ATPase